MTDVQTLHWRNGWRRRPLSLSVCRDFDTRWLGELPIAFDGTPEEISAFARSQGCVWLPDDNLLYGGRYEHPDEPLIYYPT